MWGTQSTRTKRQCKGPHPTPLSGQAGWKSTGEKICRHMYKVDPSSSWAEVLRLPSSCPWVPVSLSAGPWTSKPPRQHPCCSCWSSHGLDTISWTGAPTSAPFAFTEGAAPGTFLPFLPNHQLLLFGLGWGSCPHSCTHAQAEELLLRRSAMGLPMSPSGSCAPLDLWRWDADAPWG